MTIINFTFNFNIIGTKSIATIFVCILLLSKQILNATPVLLYVFYCFARSFFICCNTVADDGLIPKYIRHNKQVGLIFYFYTLELYMIQWSLVLTKGNYKDYE